MPKIVKKEEFKKIIEHTVPRYTVFMKKDGKYEEARKCKMIENIMGYYESEISPDTYNEIYNILKSDMDIIK